MRTFGLSMAGRGGAAGSWRTGGPALVLLCLAVYLPGLFSIPPIDRDESRFAMASWQMFTSGDYVVPRIQDRPRLNKPPLIYWLQCGSQAVFGTDGRANGGIWVFRVPGVLAAITTVLLIWRLGVRMFDPRAAWLGAALYAVCPLVVFDAHQARADQVLITTVVAAQFALWRVWKEESIKASRDRGIEGGQGRGALLGWVLVFWFAIGAGIMTKGPITPMVAALTCVFLCVVRREWRWVLRLRPALGLVIVAACVAPWVYLVAQRMGGLGAYWSIVYDETIGRSTGAKEGHWGPPGYHLVLLGVLFWPGAMLTAASISRAFRRTPDTGSTFLSRLRQQANGRPAELFLLAWIAPSWVVFELVGTKLPHYTMPLYPAVALLSARAVFAVATRRLAFRGVGAGVGTAIWCVIGGVLVLATGGTLLLLASEHTHALSWIVLMLAVGAGVVGVWRKVEGNRMIAWHAAGIGVAIIALGACLGVALPRIGSASQRVHEELARIDPTQRRPLASAKFHEDSLVFLTRGRVQRINESEIAAWSASNPEGLLVVTADWLAAAESAGGRPEFRMRGMAAGLNMGKGRFESLVIVESAK